MEVEKGIIQVLVLAMWMIYYIYLPVLDTQGLTVTTSDSPDDGLSTNESSLITIPTEIANELDQNEDISVAFIIYSTLPCEEGCYNRQS